MEPGETKIFITFMSVIYKSFKVFPFKSCGATVGNDVHTLVPLEANTYMTVIEK